MRKTDVKLNNAVMEEFSDEFMELEGVIDSSLPDPAMVEFYRRLRKREILWNADIDDSTVDVALYIRKWNGEDKGIEPEKRRPVKIFINSDGGSVDSVFHVIDMIRLSKTPVYTIGMGRVYSAGGLLLMAGHKRYIFPHTSCLIHDGSSGAFGSIGKMLDNLEFTKEMEARMKDYILKSTRISEELYDKKLQKGLVYVRR